MIGPKPIFLRRFPLGPGGEATFSDVLLGEQATELSWERKAFFANLDFMHKCFNYVPELVSLCS
jgi:hypothetical protein